MVFECAPIHCSGMTENLSPPGVTVDFAMSFLHHLRTDQHLSRTLSVPPPPQHPLAFLKLLFIQLVFKLTYRIQIVVVAFFMSPN